MRFTASEFSKGNEHVSSSKIRSMHERNKKKKAIFHQRIKKFFNDHLLRHILQMTSQ